jgi:ABC-type sugar transport system permease subunit
VSGSLSNGLSATRSLPDTPSHHLRRSRVDLLPYLLFFPALVAIGTILFYPVVQAILISLRSYYLPSVAASGTPFCGLANYQAISMAREFWNALLFNVVYTVGSVAGLYVVSLAVALLLNDDFRGRGLFRSLSIVPWAVPQRWQPSWIWIFDIQLGVFQLRTARMGGSKGHPMALEPALGKILRHPQHHLETVPLCGHHAAGRPPGHSEGAL